MVFFRKYRKHHDISQQKSNHHSQRGTISSKLIHNLTEVRSIFSQTPDLVVRHLVIKRTRSQAALVYLSGITDEKGFLIMC